MEVSTLAFGVMCCERAAEADHACCREVMLMQEVYTCVSDVHLPCPRPPPPLMGMDQPGPPVSVQRFG